MEAKEIEIKLEIDSKEYDKLVERFQREAKVVGEVRQIDEYYSPVTESYYDQGDRCLRIRTEKNVSTLSYKRIINEGLEDCYIEEYETKISDLNMMRNILHALAFRKEITVDKYRVVFVYDDIYMIALDKVEGLGWFIEVENKNENETVENRNKELLQFIDKMNLDINRRNREGYSNMLYRKNRGVCND